MRISATWSLASLVVCGIALFVPVRADDGGIAWGGSPKLLSTHPSVSMQSEVIRITLNNDTETVDCNFVFKNNGMATTVRMGFPDGADGTMDAEEEVDTQADPNWRKKPMQPLFTSFKSWVNGVPTKTTLIRADEPGNYWHAKSVFFPQSSTRIVRDLYTLPVGGSIMGSGSGSFSEASYILHTGASWHGPIGRIEVDVTFNTTVGAKTVIPVALKSLPNPNVADWSQLKRGTVIYSGPSVPTANGKTLRFVRTNCTPTEKDDILLWFSPRDSKGIVGK